MLSKVISFGLFGIEAYPVEIEVDVSHGLPAVNMVGLADIAIRESKERVKSAIRNSGFDWPAERITISLAPSDIKKEGTSFDLPIALGILAACGQLNPKNLMNYCILGELSLDGGLRPTQGVLPISIALAKSPLKNIIVPYYNLKESAIVSGVRTFPARTLKEALAIINNPDPKLFRPVTIDPQEALKQNCSYPVDFSEVKGQYLAKRALEIAVSGRHNILMIGPPGSGKSMLAKRIPTIMPELSLEEALEITKIHSATASSPIKAGLLGVRPFRAPHHTISSIALTGGGSNPRPGEISLAHQGVLFLDELPEYRRDCLEALRQPLEDGTIWVSRIKRSVVFPASFILVCAMNPCPCGYYTDPNRTCRCNPNAIANYMGKISGPLLDRIDIHIELPAIKYKELTDAKDAEPSLVIKERVRRTRTIQQERFKNEGVFYNAQINSKLIKKYCLLTEEARDLLKLAMTELNFSARAYDKILRISRTIADLAESQEIKTEHISEAIQYRNLDKKY